MYFRSLLLVEPSLGWFEPFPKSLLVKKAGSNDGKKWKNWNYIQIKLMIFAVYAVCSPDTAPALQRISWRLPVSARVSIVHACPLKSSYIPWSNNSNETRRFPISDVFRLEFHLYEAIWCNLLIFTQKHGFLILSAWCHATCQENNPNDITQEAGDPVWDP